LLLLLGFAANVCALNSNASSSCCEDSGCKSQTLHMACNGRDTDIHVAKLAVSAADNGCTTAALAVRIVCCGALLWFCSLPTVETQTKRKRKREKKSIFRKKEKKIVL
jgi:hypothetical protein